VSRHRLAGKLAAARWRRVCESARADVISFLIRRYLPKSGNFELKKGTFWRRPVSYAMAWFGPAVGQR